MARDSHSDLSNSAPAHYDNNSPTNINTSYFTPADALQQLDYASVSFGVLSKQDIHQVMASTTTSNTPQGSSSGKPKILSNGASLLGVQDGRGFLTGGFAPRSTGFPAGESSSGLVRKSSVSRSSPVPPPNVQEASTSKQPAMPSPMAAPAPSPPTTFSYAARAAGQQQQQRQPAKTNGTHHVPPATTSSPSSPPTHHQSSKSPQGPLALKPAHPSLSSPHQQQQQQRSKRASLTSPSKLAGGQSQQALAHARPSSPSSAPAVSFSRRLRIPSSVQSHYPQQQPHQQQHQQQQQPTQVQGADTEKKQPTPVPKSAMRSPPTSPPKPALKPSSWAALLRSESPSSAAASANNTNNTNGAPSAPSNEATGTATPPQQKRVSIALPPEDSSSSSSSSSSVKSGVPAASDKKASVPPALVRKKVSLGELLKGVEGNHEHPAIVPRGMVNMGNLCFENTILQALVFCPPFYNLIRLVGQGLPADLSGANRLLDATVALVNEYRVAPTSSSSSGVVGGRGQQDSTAAVPREWSDPFLPQQVYDALRHNRRFETLQQGQQEDAQEFLGFFLDSLHEELLAAIQKSSDQFDRQSAQQEEARLAAAAAAAGGGDDDWEEVGQKGRTATTRKAEVKDSPITKIFSGMLRSLLRAPGQKDSALSEPFLSLQLDIQPNNVETIEDALANLTAPETVNGYATASGRLVDATKQLFLEHLPPVLVLHLKRFSYNSVGGTVKNHKVVGYDTELSLPPSILAPSQRAAGPVEYRLCSVIYHHGRSATGGHYTVSLRQKNNKWINIDDTDIFQVAPTEVAVNRVEEVLRLSLPSSHDGVPDRSPYLLFYTRVKS